MQISLQDIIFNLSLQTCPICKKVGLELVKNYTPFEETTICFDAQCLNKHKLSGVFRTARATRDAQELERLYNTKTYLDDDD